MIDDENKPRGIAAYAQRLKELPAADGASYPQRTGFSSAATEPRLGFQSQASRQAGLSADTPQFGAPKPQGIAAQTGVPTSEPSISKVTGIAGASPMYTNNTEGDKATSGAAGFDGRAPETLNQSSTPFAGGFNPGQREQMMSSAPGFGFKTPENLQRFAAANAAKQSMIDSQPAGGFGMLGSQDAMGRSQQERENDEKTARWRQDALISEAKYRPQLAGIASDVIRGDSQQAVEGVRQQGVAAGFDAQRRGQDLNFRSQMSQQELAARGQDLNAARDNSRLGIEMGRFGLERENSAVQAAARYTLAKAMESGDPRAIAQARTQATAVGVKVEPQANLQHVETDRGTMVFDPRTGRMTPAVGADGQPVGSGKPLTEYQGKSTGFGMRADVASKIIDQVGQGGKIQPSLIKRAAEAVPLVGEGLGMAANSFQSPEQQQVEQAQRNFVNAVLRQESGAAISQSEFDNARKQYFPQPNDSQEVIAQKQANREAAINGFRVSAGPGARNIGAPQQQAEQPARQSQSAKQTSAPAVGAVDNGYVFLGGNPNDPTNWMEERK